MPIGFCLSVQWKGTERPSHFLPLLNFSEAVKIASLLTVPVVSCRTGPFFLMIGIRSIRGCRLNVFSNHIAQTDSNGQTG